MMWIKPLEFNMDISLRVCEENFDNQFFATIQKIAIYSVVPMALIAFFEAVVKNMVLINLANVGITLINLAHEVFVPLRDIL